MEQLLSSTAWLFWPRDTNGGATETETSLTIVERITSLQNQNNGSIVLPKEFLIESILPNVALVILCISVWYTCCFKFIHVLLPHIKHDPTGKTVPFEYRKGCYQVTNLCVNFCLGCLGMYYEYKYMRPDNLSGSLLVEEAITGYQNEVYFLSCFQLGYQIWSIYVGILYVNETKQMLVHHLAVIFTSTMTGCFYSGFRYFSPWLYGIIEISSVPLACVNIFKDNPEWLQKYPLRYNILRLIFALCFLFVRVYNCVPRMVIFLYHAIVVTYTSPSLWHQCYMFIVDILVGFLLFLQCYWAKLIVTGLVKQIAKIILSPKSKQSKQL